MSQNQDARTAEVLRQQRRPGKTRNVTNEFGLENDIYGKTYKLKF